MLYNSDQVARIIGVTRRRVRQLAEGGHLDGTKTGRDWIFTHKAVKNYLEGKTDDRGSENKTEGNAE